MQTHWQKYLGANIPRYTSYPSALGFSSDVGAAAYENSLKKIGQYEPISLYMHIPFCHQLCWYCGCNMRVENRYERISPYVEALSREIEMVSERLGGRGYISHVHFGGGTPNTLHAADIERLITGIEEHFGLRDETPVAMEIDPRLCSDLQVAQLVKMGIKRFSMGLQDFDPEVQTAINRVQSYEMVKNCFDLLRGAGVRDISVDLLYGLPHQRLETFRQTVEQVIELRPERISLFGYAHMPARIRHQRMIPEDHMPSREMRTVISVDAAKLFEEAGYDRIGFDHFALPDTPIAIAAREQRLNRNFQGFTEDRARNVLGFGASAISTVRGLIVQNAKEIPAYMKPIEQGELPTERGLIATEIEEALGEWLKRLLCDMRGNLNQYLKIIQADGPAREEIFSTLTPFEKDGIVYYDGDDIVIAEDAKALVRSVAAALDPHVSSEIRYASPAV
ncbi:oxygen-independent coproporphyrinogen III oxidase [Parvularcula marina]|uniref:Coproporphyrinogen-III oxidase n=1 Tax=Parvularcula marina TaxID=2292771 RepID=A0A371R7L0_9PROT|nr:oxygen-independent coproporphyrinogen III oxidase [Parvularcula marina]RFB01435.1 oxygen-independent coproporphyrinogen III oxidase [Parvularcula marina]